MEYLDYELQVIRADFRKASKYSEILYCRVIHLILVCCPHKKMKTIFAKNCDTRVKLEKLMSEEMLNHVELDFQVNSKVMAKALVKSTSTNMNVFAYKIFFFLANKAIMAYLSFFDGDHMQGFTEFKGCLQFIYYIKRYGPEECRIYSFLEDCERIFSILCASCLMDEIENRGEKCLATELAESKLDEASILQGLLYTVADCTDPSMMTTGDIVDGYVLSMFFESLGEIERTISIFKGSLAEYESSPNVHDLALRPQKGHLNDMIRRYILAVAMKLRGDPAVIRCSYKILEGLMLHGGVHMEVIWFFYCLKNYYEGTVEKVEQSFDRDLTKECVLMLNLVCEKWEKIREGYSPRTIQMPQLLLRSMFGDFVIVDEVVEESRSLERHHDLSFVLSSIKLKVKHKWFGETQMFQEYSNSMWKIEMEWVNLWKDCYLDNHSELPIEVISLLEDFK